MALNESETAVSNRAVSHPSIHRDLETELAKNAPSGLLQPARKEEEEEARRGEDCSGDGEPDADATTIRSADHRFTLIW